MDERGLMKEHIVEPYESPRVTIVGTLDELTLNGKTFAPTNDFTFPTTVTNTFSPLNFS
jgi:hypothetical protein